MMRVIINADDFGIRESTSRRIIKSISEGKVSSTTVLANGVAREMVKDCLKLFPNVSFGVHLNLTTGSSMLFNPLLQQCGIIDSQGNFTGHIRTIKALTKDELSAIKEELSAQIEEVKSLGVPISHFDGHHHVHSLPLIKPIVSELMRENEISKVRLDTQIGWSHILRDFVLAPSYAWKELKERNFFRDNYTTTDCFSSIDKYYDDLVHIVKPDNHSVVELMCHLGDHHAREREIVETEALRPLMQYQLISYQDI